VKSFDELRDEVSRSFAIEAEALLNGEQLLIVASAAEAPSGTSAA
jgi:hypothetical protein